MTGLVTSSVEFYPGGFKVTLDWRSDASGDVLADLYSELDVGLLTGQVLWIETAPGENGDLTTDLPTADYDVYFLDTHGLDWAGGVLADRSGTAAEVLPGSLTVGSAAFDLSFVGQRLILKVDNAGDTKRGRIIANFKNLF
jgi:hypothetical protein